jgi:poly-gamma-glutamate synthesis protein (capsule biosynthesis protein)
VKRGTIIALGVVMAVLAVAGAAALLATRDERVDAGGNQPGTATTLDPPPSSLASTSVPPSPTDASVTTSPPTTAPPTRSFSIAATGDFLIHSTVANAARLDGGTGYDFSPMLRDVEPLLSSADLAVCHLEVPLSADNTDISGYPVFAAPRELARDIGEAGYDTCSTVSNHALDRGFAGVVNTLDALDEAGVRHAGSARTAEEATAPTLLDVEGVSVAHLAYAYGFNGLPIPAEAPWSVNAIDPARIIADAGAARAAGAEFVLVSLQWGAEYQQAPTADQQAIAATLLSAPEVDLIIGHHVHVVQPVGTVGPKTVAYGLGNFLSNQSPEAGLLPSTQDGVILHLEVTETAPGQFTVAPPTFTPTFVDRTGGYVIRPVDATTNPDSYQRTLAAMTALGTPGVVPER